MTVATRPSKIFWLVALIVYGFLLVAVMAAQLWAIIATGVHPYDGAGFLESSAAIGILPTFLFLWPRYRSCIWKIDFDGFSSPSIGRIDFKDVVALHIGYPGRRSLTARLLHCLNRYSEGYVRVVKLFDGRLLPLNIESPAIRNHEDFVAKLTELLKGKIRPNSEYTKAEIILLVSRPTNRCIRVQKGKNTEPA